MNRRVVIGAAALTVLLIGAGAFALVQNRDDGASAAEIAASFVGAYGDLDAERAISYMADDADVSGLWTSVGTAEVKGRREPFRALMALFSAQGYSQFGTSCKELDTSDPDAVVQCTFNFHLLGSEKLGRGPFSGSFLTLTVRDGAITRASSYWDIGTFSPQMWEPFATWVAKTHPKDAALMYSDGSYSGVRLDQESIRLWGEHVRGFVNANRS